MYTALYMASTRTQVYLTAEQRRLLDELARREHRSMAALVREALDRYLSELAADPTAALQSTFGLMPDLEVPPRDEWNRRG
jgi:hypothetical protein